MLARAAARVGSARGLCPRQVCICLKSACRCAGTSPEGGAVAAGVAAPLACCCFKYSCATQGSTHGGGWSQGQGWGQGWG